MLSNGERRRRRSSVVSDPHNRLIVDDIQRTGAGQLDLLASAKEIGMPVLSELQARANIIAVSEGEGALGRAATWDDFPNGRFGDSRSAAFGLYDGYGISLPVSTSQARRLWGAPKHSDDISSLFLKHIHGELSTLPWSEDGLNPESEAIKMHLLRLNMKSWWTVASQPAVNAVKSTHEVFGWGPPGGFVFQKAFVEFFICKESWYNLKPKLDAQADVSYYAADFAGSIETSALQGDVNAVTWAVFPGKEIITPTIIELESFSAWREKAFTIWKEWQMLYLTTSPTYQLLNDIQRNLYLVNIVHHDYINSSSLWDLLEV